MSCVNLRVRARDENGARFPLNVRFDLIMNDESTNISGRWDDEMNRIDTVAANFVND